MDKELLKEIIGVSREAGRSILKVYGTDYGVSFKEDRSPLTEADRRSHEEISAALGRLTPEIPIISEEGAATGFETRRHWETFYLVDPLDGTKEFISKNGEFTVNIALIHNRRPALGVIHVPVEDSTYFAVEGGGAFRMKGESAPERISVRKDSGGGLIAVASRSHPSPEVEELLKGLSVRERISKGSSLKFCLVAEGRAHIYPRLSPTWEWDTAAGDIIVEEAGGTVIAPSGDMLSYNKESLKHAGFIALSDMGLFPRRG